MWHDSDPKPVLFGNKAVCFFLNTIRKSNYISEDGTRFIDLKKSNFFIV